MLKFFTRFRIVDHTNNAIKRPETVPQYIDALTQCSALVCGRDNLIPDCSQRHLNSVDLNGTGGCVGWPG